MAQGTVATGAESDGRCTRKGVATDVCQRLLPVGGDYRGKLAVVQMRVLVEEATADAGRQE